MTKAARRAVLEVLFDSGNFETVDTIKQTLVDSFHDEGDAPTSFMREPDQYINSGLQDLLKVGLISQTGLSYYLNEKGRREGGRLLQDFNRYAEQKDDTEPKIVVANFRRGFPRFSHIKGEYEDISGHGGSEPDKEV